MNKYVAFWRQKSVVVEANTSFEAQEKAAVLLKAKKSWEITTMLAEKDGKPYVHSTASL